MRKSLFQKPGVMYLNRNQFKGMLITTKELVGNDFMISGIYPNTVWILLTIYGLCKMILKRMMVLIYLSSLVIEAYQDWLCRVQMLTENRDAP